MPSLSASPVLAVALLLFWGPQLTSAEPSSPRVSSQASAGPAPWTGMVLWADNDAMADYQRSIALEFQYFRYDQVASGSPGSGYVYNWSAVHTFLEGAASRGHHGVLRFRDTDPTFADSPGLPASLNTNTRTARYNEAIAGARAAKVLFPDWSNPNLTPFLVEFYSKFAAEFDDDPSLAFLQVGFGLWGEYHLDFDNLSGFSDPSITDVSSSLGRIFPSKSDQVTILKTIQRTLKTTPWSISIDAADSHYTPFASAPELRDINFGLFDDSFLNSGGNAQNWTFFSKFPATPNGGEISYYTEDDQENALSGPGPNGVSLSAAVRKRALSYLVGNDQPQYRSPGEIAAAGKSMGYRFSIVNVVVDGGLTQVTIKNTGVASVFFDVYPAVGNTLSPTSLKGLMPGERRTCSIAAAYAGGNFSLKSPKRLPGQIIPFDGN